MSASLPRLLAGRQNRLRILAKAGTRRFCIGTFWISTNVPSMPNPTNWSVSTIYIWLGHVFFWVLIASCILYYQERLLSFDTAYYTFHLVTFQEYFIKHDRYISYLTQWVPLMGIDRGWSLANVFRAYSASFYLWFYLLYILIVHGFKNVLGGLLLVFTLCLAMRYKFYAAISEITFGLVIATVLISWLSRKPKQLSVKPLDFVVVGLCLAALFGAHVVPIYPIMTFLVFQRLYEGTWREPRQWIMPGFIVLVFALKLLMVQGDSYESNRLSDLLQPGSLIDLFTNRHDHFIFSAISEYFTREYWLVSLLFVGVLVWLFRMGKWLAGLFIAASALGWLLINIITYADLGGPLYIMLDGYLAVFGLIWGTPFIFFLRDHPLFVYAWATVGLIAFSTWRMVRTQEFYNQRLEYIQETLAMYPGDDQQKIIVPREHFHWDRMWFPYEVAHESLMLTALEHPDSTRTIYVDIDAPEGADFLQNDGFIQFHGAHHINAINQPRFFNLPEGTYFTVDSVAWMDY